MVDETPGLALRGRWRLLGATLLTGAVVAGGVYAERGLGLRASAGVSSTSASTGAWLCPHGGGPGWEGWIVIVNDRAEDTLVRLSPLGTEAPGAQQRVNVPAGTLRYIEVPVEDRAASTFVEFFGGPVTVSTVLVKPEGDEGAGAASAAPCAARAGTDWYSADGTTTRDHATWVVVMNPFAEAAEFDVVLRTPQGPPDGEIRPGEWTGYVLKPRRSTVLYVNDFALDKDGLGTEVHAALGKVAVGVLGVAGGGGISQTIAVEAPSDRVILPAGADSGEAGSTLVNLGEERADLTLRSQGPAAQRLVEGFEDFSLGFHAVQTIPLTLPGGSVGLEAQSSNSSSIVGARRANGQKGDVGVTEGAGVPAARWVVPPSLPPAGGRGLLVLENPGSGPVEVVVRLIGENGAEGDASTVAVPAGRVVVLPLETEGPVAAVVEANAETIVAASASYSLGGAGYAVSLGVPF